MCTPIQCASASRARHLRVEADVMDGGCSYDVQARVVIGHLVGMWCFTCVLMILWEEYHFFFFFQAEDGIRDLIVTGVQTCALPIFPRIEMKRKNFFNIVRLFFFNHFYVSFRFLENI